MLSDLPRDLAEEVLIRLTVTSLRAVRCVCKKWKALAKGRSFRKKHLAQAKAAAAREPMVVMLISDRVYLRSLNLHSGVDEPSITPRGKLKSRLEIREVCHCDGLLLCVTADQTRFVVWNPYSGQTLWFNFSSEVMLWWWRYAIGFANSSKSCRSYKVLTFSESEEEEYVRCELYYINSRDDITIGIPMTTIFPDWHVEFDARGVSLKGNTYWFARDKLPPVPEEIDTSEMTGFLVCFDFTTERFGPRLTLPFDPQYDQDTVALSSVRDEQQFAVLFQRWDTLRMEIWITTKIEPEAASWSKAVFLAVDVDRQFAVPGASFFLDEEKKVAVVLDIFHDDRNRGRASKVAYIIGEDGYFKKEKLEEDPSIHFIYTFPHVFPLVPSLVHIKRGRIWKKKKTDYLKIVDLCFDGKKQNFYRKSPFAIREHSSSSVF